MDEKEIKRYEGFGYRMLPVTEIADDKVECLEPNECQVLCSKTYYYVMAEKGSHAFIEVAKYNGNFYSGYDYWYKLGGAYRGMWVGPGSAFNTARDAAIDAISYFLRHEEIRPYAHKAIEKLQNKEGQQLLINFF